MTTALTTHAEIVAKAHEIKHVVCWFITNQCNIRWVYSRLRRVRWTKDDLISEVSFLLLRRSKEHGGIKGTFTTVVANTTRYILLALGERGRGAYYRDRFESGAYAFDETRGLACDHQRQTTETTDLRLEWLEKALDDLAPHHQRIVRQFYGLGGTPAMTMAEIAKANGVTRQNVSTMMRLALRKIQAKWKRETGEVLPPFVRCRPNNRESAQERYQRKKRYQQKDRAVA